METSAAAAVSPAATLVSAVETEPQIVLFPGRAVFVPVPESVLTFSGKPWTPGATGNPDPPLILWGSATGDRENDRARSMTAELWRIITKAAPPSEGEATWLPPLQEWRALRCSPGAAPALSDGATVMFAAILEPPDDFRGRFVRVNSTRFRITWLDSPPGEVDRARAPVLRATPDRLRTLGKVLWPEATDPFRRWRVSLICDRLGAAALWPDGGPPQIADPVLRLASEQLELRWRAALAELAARDADLAADVIHRLTAIVRFPDGQLLPAWPLRGAAATALLQALLDGSASPEASLQAARSFLDQCDPALVWVIDDAGSAMHASEPGGSADSRGRAVSGAIIGIADLTGRGLIASATCGNEGPPVQATIAPHASAVIGVPTDPTAESSITVRCGDWSRQVAVSTVPVPIEPPGLRIGPLLREQTLQSLTAEAPRFAEPEHATAALLFRDAESPQWKLYVECRRAESANRGATDDTSRDRVIIGFGPGTEPCATIEVLETGRAVDLLPAVAAEFDVPVRHDIDRWSFTLPVPESCIETARTTGGPVLHLSLQRIDEAGERASWPRAMLPGQVEPGRIGINIGTWDHGSGAGR